MSKRSRLPEQPGRARPARTQCQTLCRRVALAIGFSIFGLYCVSNAQGEEANEYQVKAAYLYNFAKLAAWPKQSLPDGASALVMCVFGGDDEFVGVLGEAVAGRTIAAHPLVVRRVSAQDELKSCHLVFFRASERSRTPAAIASLQGADVLLVGEDKSFLRQGGMINLVLEKGKIHFEINQDSLDRANIHFSAKILLLAKADSSLSNPSPGGRQLKIRVDPQYPEVAQRMNLTGTAQVEAIVRPDGTVRNVRVVGGHPLLADALVRAVSRWRYEPAARETTELVKFSFGQ